MLFIQIVMKEIAQNSIAACHSLSRIYSYTIFLKTFFSDTDSIMVL